MGNSPKQTALTRHWKHVSPSLIRNETTRELIQEQSLSFANPDHQTFYFQLLTKRIRLQHPNILKLIYFAHNNSMCTCSTDQKPYRTLVYTEHFGESLPDYLRINSFPFQGNCFCVGIIQGLIYLQQYYGFFEVSAEKVFLGIEQQNEDGRVKVWINSNTAECQPQKSCSEREMMVSLVSLYSFIRNNGFCTAMSDDWIEASSTIRTLSQMKTEIIHLHRQSLYSEGKRKKSSSLFEMNKSRKDTYIVDFQDEKPEVIKSSKQPKQQYRYQSTPHTVQNVGQNVPQLPRVNFVHQERPATDRPPLFKQIRVVKPQMRNTTISTQNTLTFVANPSIQFAAVKQNSFSLLNSKPYPKKIHFNYALGVQSNHFQNQRTIFQGNKDTNVCLKEEGRINRVNLDQNQFKNNIVHLSQREISVPVVSFQQINEQKAVFNQNMAKATLSQTQIVLKSKQSLIKELDPSLNERQFDTNKQQQKKIRQVDFTGRQMQIFLPEQQTKDTNGQIPTTSRSPKVHKEETYLHPPIAEEMQVPFLPISGQHERRSKRINSYSSSKGESKFNKAITSKCQKLQQYTKQIIQTEESIRQWMSRSTGARKVKKLQQVSTAPIKPGLKVEPPQQYKQAKSIYNDSQYRNNQGSKEEEFRIHTEECEQKYYIEITNEKSEPKLGDQKQRDIELQLFEEGFRNQYMKQKQEEMERLKKIEIEREQEKKFQEEHAKRIVERSKRKSHMQQQRKLREKQEKIQMQKDLENEKKMIQNEMDDLLRNSAMKDEYRSIREKVKQKKETFAQLKAQAAKILDDCLY